MHNRPCIVAIVVVYIFNLFNAQIPELSLPIVRLNWPSHERFLSAINTKGIRMRYSFYALVTKQEALREAGLFCLPRVPYNHDFCSLRPHNHQFHFQSHLGKL